MRYMVLVIAITLVVLHGQEYSIGLPIFKRTVSTDNDTTIQPDGAIVSDTDKTGGALILKTGNTTGNATPPNLYLATTITGPSGTTLQSYVNKFMLRNKIYVMPDNVGVNIWSINLPTSNTAASVHMSFTYVVTDGTNAGSHSGIYICALVNNGGTISGNCTDSGEAVAGIGAGVNIDTAVINITGTTATFNIKFNNTFGSNPNGSMTVQVINNSASSFTWL